MKFRVHTRHGLIHWKTTATLLAVLAGAILLAEYLTASRPDASLAGRQAIAELLRGDLRKLWGPEPRTLYYFSMKTVGNRTIPERWQAEHRQRASDGSWSGWAAFGDADGALYKSRWTLSRDGQRGEYLAMFGRGPVATMTKIELTGRQVRVSRSVGNAPPQASAVAQAPDNYVPEGTQDAVYFQIARNAQTAEINQIDDSRSLVRTGNARQGQVAVAFYTTRIESEGPMAVSIEGSAGKVIFQYNQRGDLLKVTDSDGNIIRQQVPEREFLQAFPRAAADLPPSIPPMPVSAPPAEDSSAP